MNKMYSVEGKEFDLLSDAVKEAISYSLNNGCSQITTPHVKGIYGYAGQCRVIASFRDGYDLRSIAADEDGNPDYDMRKESLT